MKALLSDDARLVGDGGGKVRSFLKVQRGADRLAHLYWGLSRLAAPVVYRMAQINGEPGLLRWAEIVTDIPHSDPSDEEFATLRAHFSDVEIAELGFAIAVINTWNLLNVSFRNPVPEKV